jgi:hypothetical protein
MICSSKNILEAGLPRSIPISTLPYCPEPVSLSWQASEKTSLRFAKGDLIWRFGGWVGTADRLGQRGDLLVMYIAWKSAGEAVYADGCRSDPPLPLPLGWPVTQCKRPPGLLYTQVSVPDPVSLLCILILSEIGDTNLMLHNPFVTYVLCYAESNCRTSMEELAVATLQVGTFRHA